MEHGMYPGNALRSRGARLALALFTAHFVAASTACSSAGTAHRSFIGPPSYTQARAERSPRGGASDEGAPQREDWRRAGSANAAPPSFAPATPADTAAGAPAVAPQPPAPGGGSTTPGTGAAPTATREGSWQLAQATPNMVRLATGDRETLPLRGVQIRTQIDGFRARVVLDAYFFNDRGAQLEGTFQLRLPDGASPYFFAFGETTYAASDAQQASVPFFAANVQQGAGLGPEDILRQRAQSWNQPREARVVPRERAALAYTETVRQRVDPALMEWAGAGMFEARVFPLQTQRMHRVVIGYDVSLERRGDALVLPLGLPGEGVESVVDVSVAQPRGVGVQIEPAAQSRSEGGYWTARVDHPRGRSLTVRVQNAPGVLTGSDDGGNSYFATTLAPQVAATQGTAPARAVFALDTSLSSQPEQFHQWLRVIEANLTQNAGATREFAVLYFDVGARWWRPSFVPNSPENVRAFLADANQAFLEGATDMGAALAEAARPRWYNGPADQGWDTFLLSDGAATWGESDTRRVAERYRAARRGRLFAYRLGTSTGDGAALARLTRANNGTVFTLNAPNELDALAVAHRSDPWRLAGVEVPGATEVLVAGNPSAIFPGQTLSIVGRGQPAQGSVARVRLTRGGQENVVQVPLGGALSSSLAPRAYGEVAVARLEDLHPIAERQARSYATHFRVTGRTCSLVMLENEAAYQRFGIVPADDALAVRQQTPTDLLAGVAREGEAELSNPRTAFLNWLDRLPQTPGVTITVARELRDALAQTPERAFELADAPVVLPLPTQSDAPGEYRQQLGVEELDYDLVSREAERRRSAGQVGPALRAMSSVVERRPGDVVLARDVAFTASQWGMPGAAYGLLRRVQAARPYEMHTYRSLAETAAALGRNELALAYYDLAWRGQWGARQQDFRAISGVGYLHFLREIARGTRTVSFPELARARLNELMGEVRPERADVLVMIAWSTDNTDVDLHVVDPSGEECFYGHRNTAMGGFLTQDVTQGYGPEMFVLPHAAAGHYRVFAHFYSSNRQRSSAHTRVLATVVRRWGAANEEATTHALTLGDRGDRQDIVNLDWAQ